MKKRVMLLGVLVCLCNVNLAGQSKYSFAEVSYSLGILCSTPVLDPTAVCPETDWVITDDQGNVDYSGLGGALGHDEYGLLQASDTAVVFCSGGCGAGSAASGAGSQATFTDTLTFPRLIGSGPYYLVVSLTVVGSVSGGFLREVSTVEVNASANLTDGTTSNSAECTIQDNNVNQGVVRKTCGTKMQIFPGDVVSFSGLLGVGANAVVPNSASAITQTVGADFSSKGYGARYVLHVLYANGLPVPGGVIIAASGTNYQL